MVFASAALLGGTIVSTFSVTGSASRSPRTSSTSSPRSAPCSPCSFRCRGSPWRSADGGRP
jgi:hypothetical protein